MGTRSLTFFYDNAMADAGKPFLNVYRQFDGYPSGHGLELANFLNKLTLLNGYSSEQEDGAHANGMGCLAAQFLASFKKGIGNIYIHSVEDNDCWQDYEYHVFSDGVRVVYPYDDKVIFQGSWSELKTFCEKAE